MRDDAWAEMIPPRLLRAYRATRYEAAGVAVRIGRRSAAMDAVLDRMGARVAGFITAWNPRSRRMPDGWNRRMQGRLAERLRRHACVPARGSLRRWHEDHLLAAADPGQLLRLARVFRQYGIVVVVRGRPARLLLRDDAIAS